MEWTQAQIYQDISEHKKTSPPVQDSSRKMRKKDDSGFIESSIGDVPNEPEEDTTLVADESSREDREKEEDEIDHLRKRSKVDILHYLEELTLNVEWWVNPN